MYSLTGDPRYLDALQASRPIFADYAERVASGVAHGLEALSNDALGILNIKAGKEADLESLRAALAKLPWRRCSIQITDDAEIPADHFQLCQGSTCGLPSANPQEILSILHAS
jgi:uncharacterized protein YyaL (SSP411 family)